MTSAANDDVAMLAAEIDRLRVALKEAAAALDTAEARERSRIADDLHDILGHALEVVAFKAELAARFVGIDAGRARGELIEIQRVSRSAMSDVRSLALCRRATDLAAELDLTVSLFESAGVEVTVTGDAHSMPACAKEPLARALRESVTNVLRHAKPTLCCITFEQDSHVASVAIVNDGVEAHASELSRGGTGLAGLVRMLAEHGGRLEAGHNARGRFVVRATVATPAAANREHVVRRIPRAGRAAVRLLSVQR